MVIKITPNDKGSPAGKLADAELHFDGGELEGLKLVGFAVWERRTGTGRNVTFPARAYSVNGERRSFALLRPDGRHRQPGQGARRHPARLRRLRGTGSRGQLTRQASAAAVVPLGRRLSVRHGWARHACPTDAGLPPDGGPSVTRLPTGRTRGRGRCR